MTDKLDFSKELAAVVRSSPEVPAASAQRSRGPCSTLAWGCRTQPDRAAPIGFFPGSTLGTFTPEEAGAGLDEPATPVQRPLAPCTLKRPTE